MNKLKKLKRKVRKFSKRYTIGVNAYLDEDRKQAMKMKPNAKKIRF